MKKSIKRLLIITVLFSAVNIAMADRGGKKKAKSKIALNIITQGSLKNSIPFNYNLGLSYKGSLATSVRVIGGTITNSSIMTYQKGNTTYIIPVKQRLIMPDIRNGYPGIRIMLH